MDSQQIIREAVRFGLSQGDADRLVAALEAGGALTVIRSAHVPRETEPYLALRDGSDLTVAYVHKSFVDVRSQFAPKNAFDVEHYEGIHRVPFPSYSHRGSQTRGSTQPSLANCAEHFMPLNPDGSCDYCEPER